MFSEKLQYNDTFLYFSLVFFCFLGGGGFCKTLQVKGPHELFSKIPILCSIQKKTHTHTQNNIQKSLLEIVSLHPGFDSSCMLLDIRDTNWALKHLPHDLHTWSFVSLLFFCLSAALTTLTEDFSDGLSWELMAANEQGGASPKQSGRKWSEKLQFLSLGASITSVNMHPVHSLCRQHWSSPIKPTHPEHITAQTPV